MDQIKAVRHGDNDRLIMLHILNAGLDGYQPSDFIHMSAAKALELRAALNGVLPPEIPEVRSRQVHPDPSAAEPETLKSLRWLMKQIEDGVLVRDTSRDGDRDYHIR